MAVYTIPSSTGTPRSTKEIEDAIAAQNVRLLLIENKLLELSQIEQINQRITDLETLVGAIAGDYVLTIEIE